jgi:hypothetical protein
VRLDAVFAAQYGLWNVAGAFRPAFDIVSSSAFGRLLKCCSATWDGSATPFCLMDDVVQAN